MTKYQSKSAEKYLYAYFELFEIQNGYKIHLEQSIHNSSSISIAKLGGIHTWGYPMGGSKTRIVTKMFQNISIMSINRKFRQFGIMKWPQHLF